jgi:hypothetical protein
MQGDTEGCRTATLWLAGLPLAHLVFNFWQVIGVVLCISDSCELAQTLAQKSNFLFLFQTMVLLNTKGNFENKIVGN